jgi:hypothetical protein
VLGLPSLADVDHHQVLLADGAVGRRLDQLIRQVVTHVVRPVRLIERQLRQVVAPFVGGRMNSPSGAKRSA